MNPALNAKPASGYDPDKLKDVQDLFSGEREGHYIHRCFVTSAQLAKWADFMKWPFYYATRNEPPIIPVAARHTAELITNPHGVIGVENGPGTESGMLLKTFPYYSNIPNLHTLVGRDWSKGVCDIFKDVLGSKLQGVRLLPDLSDFNKHALPIGLAKGQRAFAEFGFSRGNLEGKAADGYPMNVLEADADHLASLMNAGDTYAVTIDANPDPDAVLKSYSGDAIIEWGREHLRDMKRTLPIEGDFDPESFITNPQWFGADTWLCNNNFVPLRKMEFKIGEMEHTAHPGDHYAFTNQWKVPVDPIVDVYESRDIQLKALPKDNQGWIHIPVFQKNL